MSAVAATKHYTSEEYLQLEEGAVEKHEFYKGEIFALSGGSVNHNTISGNVFGKCGLS